MRKIINLLAILLIVSCTKPQEPKKQLKIKDTIAIEKVTIDYLLNNNWEIQQTRKLYYPPLQDSDMMYLLIPDSVGIKYYYAQYSFHIIKKDTFIHYYDGSATWYPQNLNLITNKQK